MSGYTVLAALAACAAATAAVAESEGTEPSSGQPTVVGHSDPSRGAAVQDAAPDSAAVTPGTQSGAVGMDSLLRLPSSYSVRGERHGGANAGEWRSRFDTADRGVEDAQAELARAQRDLERSAGQSGQWQMAAPGLGSADSEHATVSYKLRQEIRTLREGVDEAERKRKALVVEADLAGVPEAWRGSGRAASATPTSTDLGPDSAGLLRGE